MWVRVRVRVRVRVKVVNYLQCFRSSTRYRERVIGRFCRGRTCGSRGHLVGESGRKRVKKQYVRGTVQGSGVR